jgi:hypothetical protein
VLDRYAGKSEHELKMMAYGALSLWLIVWPKRFGRAPIPASEMSAAADRANRVLRKMFHDKPSKPWRARREQRGAKTYQFAKDLLETLEGQDFF